MSILKKDIKMKIYFYISCIFYSLTLAYVHSTYLLERQEFWGYSYFPMDYQKYIFLFLSIFITSFFTPLKIDKPSNIIVYTLFMVVIVPTLTLTLGLREDSLTIYGFDLLCLLVGYLFLASSALLSAKIFKVKNYYFPSKNVDNYFVVFWFLCFFMLIYLFKDIINFVGLDDIYGQRSAGKSRNLFEGYMQTYLPNVICSALLVIGLYRKKYLYVLFSVFGYLLMFGINAQRTVFLMPIILYLLYLYLKSGSYNKNLLIRTNFILSFIFVCVGVMPNGIAREFIGFYVVTRVIATPGIMFSLYHDVFSMGNYTYWSHVKGISWIVERPSAFMYDQDWPQLGYIVAKYRLGIVSNSNANLFAADGVAAAGGLGIIVISIIFAIYLFLLDYFSKNIDPRFKVIVAFPVGLALTNGSLATILLSFGGLFWLAFYFFINAKNLK